MRHACFYALLTLFSFASCHQDNVNDDLLKGKWNIVKAARNGKITTTLEDGFFDFKSDTILRSNIFDQEKEYRMTKNEKGFLQHDREVGNVQYDIQVISSDSMTLNADIKDYKFLFLAVRDSILID